MFKKKSDWSFLDCKICAKASVANHRSKRPEDVFHLCPSCTESIEALKGKKDEPGVKTTIDEEGIVIIEF